MTHSPTPQKEQLSTGPGRKLLSILSYGQAQLENKGFVLTFLTPSKYVSDHFQQEAGVSRKVKTGKLGAEVQVCDPSMHMLRQEGCSSRSSPSIT